MEFQVPPLISPIRPAVGAVAAVALVSLVGGGVPVGGMVRQAGVAAAALYVGDMYKARYGDGSLMGQVSSTAVSAAAFAGINKLVLGVPDAWTTLAVAGAAIDVVALFVENPIASAIGL